MVQNCFIKRRVPSITDLSGRIDSTPDPSPPHPVVQGYKDTGI